MSNFEKSENVCVYTPMTILVPTGCVFVNYLIQNTVMTCWECVR